MAACANTDLYPPFPHGSMLEESGPSSEEGSGLHSPIFSQYTPHGDSNLRYRPEQLDIQNAAGILASHFDYNGLSHLHVHQGSLLNAPLDPDSDHRANYASDFTLSSRSQLGLDLPIQSLSNTRLPPPPTQSSQVYFNSSPDRSYAEETSHGTSYSTSGLPMDAGDQQPSSSSVPPAQGSSSGTRANTSTSQEPRKESSGVVIACRQCRARKIRCDSTRPVCNNCVRRSNECQYDAAPKRRGPDKRPGTRQRSCKKRPADGSAPPPPSKRKRTATAQAADINGTQSAGVKENMASMKSTFSSSTRGAILVEDTRGQSHMLGALSPPSIDLKPPRGVDGQAMFNTSSSPATRRIPISSYDNDVSFKSFRPLDVNIRQSDTHSMQGKSPSLQPLEFPRKIWWENLLDTYSATRDESLKDITSDLSSLFNTTGYWLSFINVTSFIRNLYSTEERSHMQPAVIYAGLALATLMKSSQLELGTAGSNRALWLRDAAQSNMEQSLNSQWIDVPLAEAALMLALFESSAHPQYSPTRAASSLGYLDNIIRRLQLTTIDSNDPDVSSFKPHHVPSVKTRSPSGLKDHSQKCSCIPLPPNANLPPDHFSSSWSYAPPWDPSWSPNEVNKEECRRLCWSALTLIAGYTSQSAAFDKEPLQFHLTDPGNYALLFPGEVTDRSSGRHRSAQSPKDSVWALYCRSMLLWNFSTRLSSDSMSSNMKAEYAFEVWVETQSIQDALDTHVCNLDTALLYMCREYLYNTRVTVTRTLRRFVASSDVGISHHPVFSRKEAEEWLYYQDQVIKRVKSSINHLGEAQGHLLTRRPFQVTWFSSQLAICLSLWNNDRSLINALTLGKSVLVLVDILNVLWPCSLHQSRTDELRKRLNEACTAAGVPSPLPPDFSLPTILKA